jgi:MYXO-CTERM domain-containing protein
MSARPVPPRWILPVLLLAPAAVGAHDWPCARHDPQRTGAATGPLRLPSPAVRWRHYLGGQLRDDQWRVADVDGDQVTDVVFVASGKVICKHADDSLVWESDLVEARSLVGLADLDRDGRLEVVVVGERGAVLVLNGATGRALWEVPREQRGIGASARLGDLDGDGLAELYVGQCLVSAVGSSVYSFRDGYAAPRTLWQVPSSTQRCGTQNDLLADLDGDGMSEVVIAQGDSTMRVLDGRSGVLRWEVPAPMSGSFTQMSIPLAVNVDDDPAAELVVVTNTIRAGTPGFGARRVAVFDPPAPTRSTATLRWEVVQAQPDGGGLAFTPDSVVDLDGDGRPELVASFYDGAARRWDLTVRDASTGAVRASREGFELVGVLPANASGADRPVLLGVQDDRASAALSLSDGALSVRWTLPSRRPALALDPSLAPRLGFAYRPLAMQLDADPALELLTTAFDPALPAEARTVTTLVAYDLNGPTPAVLGTLEAPMATTMLTFQTGANLSREITQPLVVTSDGYLLALDEALRPTNRLVGTEFTIPGMRVGGYYSGPGIQGPTPVIGALPGASGPERAVLVRDSRKALLRLDARRASLASPPTVRWQRARAGWPLIADLDGDGANDLAALDGRALISIDPAQGAALRWSVEEAAGPTGSSTSGDVLPLRRAGEAGVDLVFMRIDPGFVVRPSSFRGRDGALRWNTFSRTPHSGIGTFAVADLSGDGTEDVLTTLNALNRLDGRDGTASPDAYVVPYGSPIVSAWSGSVPEVYLQASLHDALLDRDFQLRGQVSDLPVSSNAGAVLRCAEQPALALCPSGTAELRVIHPQDLPSMGAAPASATLARAVLAGGRAYPTREMVPATERVGTLSNITAVADGDGAGHPTLLVGGSDGWLYALDGCSLALRWAHDFRYPVGEPVVGDADGDGTDDVLVTVGDGYLYAMGARTLPTPEEVRDTDPANDASDADLDEVETFDTVTARWATTPGAMRFQVRVTTLAGTGLQFPEYTEVTGDRARVGGLPLRLGGRYRVGVVAVGADGSSAEALSDGFTVVDVSPPTIRIGANPASFTPPTQTTNLEVTFDDRTGLVSTRAELLDPTGAVVRVLVDEALRSPLPSRTTRFTFDGIAADGTHYLPPGVYTIRASATDVRDHAVTATGTFTMLERVVTPGTRRDEADGCACATGRVGGASRGPWLLAALGLAAARRRRRGSARR